MQTALFGNEIANLSVGRRRAPRAPMTSSTFDVTEVTAPYTDRALTISLLVFDVWSQGIEIGAGKRRKSRAGLSSRVHRPSQTGLCKTRSIGPRREQRDPTSVRSARVHDHRTFCLQSRRLVADYAEASVVVRHTSRTQAVGEVGIRTTRDERFERLPRAGFIPDAFAHCTNRKKPFELHDVPQ
jgi:hypothetical protein